MSKEPDKICVRIYATRGLSAKIARALGTHRSAVYQWKRVPAGESATGGGHHGADARANQA